MRESTLILGLGNLLLSDEGVGLAVVRRLQAELSHRDDLAFVDGGTLSFTLAAPIGACRRLIVIDAAALGAAPGTVRVFEGEAMDLQLRGGGASVHEVSLSDLMDIARLTDSLPARRAMIGIQPHTIDWGEALTPPVAAAIPQAMTIVKDLIARWSVQPLGERRESRNRDSLR
jgi:hydrogenase maturation protease